MEKQKGRVSWIKALRLGIFGLVLIGMACVSIAIYLFAGSLPYLSGTLRINELRNPVTVRFDELGVPTIDAQSKSDAIVAFGFLTAQDRFFQMDLLRKTAAGRLAELDGSAAVASDCEQRQFRFQEVAEACYKELPKEQRELLDCYTSGVNAWLRSTKEPPPEYLFLGVKPEEWNSSDSILVFLVLFQSLSYHPNDEFTLQTMKEALPPSVVSFLLPEQQRPWNVPGILTGALTRHSTTTENVTWGNQLGLFVLQKDIPGSNAWALSGSKAKDGHAILANDMHMGLSVPNIWYRCNLKYPGSTISGATVPGLPMISVGSNGFVAWGFTNSLADVMDWVELETDSRHPNQYRIPMGWAGFKEVKQTIHVKNCPDQEIQILVTQWGPVIRERSGKKYALKWTALDPYAINFSLSSMDAAAGVADAISVMNRSGGPPLNVILADRDGNIAWTLTGKFPRRKGFDGTVPMSWSNGVIDWNGYLNPDELPKIVNPVSGFIENANQKMSGVDYGLVQIRNSADESRASQIKKYLSQIEGATQEQMLKMQLDTNCDIYRFYQSLALKIISQAVHDSDLVEIKDEVSAWDGKADLNSRGIVFLVHFQENLKEALFSKLLKPCRESDPEFIYSWDKSDIPLQELLKILPKTALPQGYGSWNEFLIALMKQTRMEVLKKLSAKSLSDVEWGAYRRVQIEHPLFSAGFPQKIGEFTGINMRRDGLPGCSYSIRVSGFAFGATLRMVVSPGREKYGMFNMPCGQEGHFLSEHYSDQEDLWLRGQPARFMSEKSTSVLNLKPF